MPAFLDAQGRFENERAREAMRAYGVKDAKLIKAVSDLDNTDPENLKIDCLAGTEIKDCVGALYMLALLSDQAVELRANGLKITAVPLSRLEQQDDQSGRQ